MRRVADDVDAKPVPPSLSRVHVQLIAALRRMGASADTASALAIMMTCQTEAGTGSSCSPRERQAQLEMPFAYAISGIAHGIDDYLAARARLTQQLAELRILLRSTEIIPVT